MKFNFEKYSKSEVNSLGKKYDYASVMHYGPYDFAKRDGLKTISSLQKGKTFGDKPKLSKLDREQARLLYKCSKGKYNSFHVAWKPVSWRIHLSSANCLIVPTV